MPEANVNVAPWPADLEDLVANLRYRSGWQFNLAVIDRGQGSKGLTLDIVTTDSYNGSASRCWGPTITSDPYLIRELGAPVDVGPKFTGEVVS